MGRWSRLVGEIFLDWLDAPAGLRWLDVGCGNGAFLKFVASESPNLNLHGIDLSDTAKDKAIAFHQGDFLTFDFGARFDAIVSLAVIEHLA